MDGSYEILALDLATQTGWARSRLDGDSASSGSLYLGGGAPELKGLNLTRFLDEQYAAAPFHHLIYESPIAVIHMKNKTNVNTTRIAFGLPEVAKVHALRLGVRADRLREATPNQYRKHFIGMTSAGNRNETKHAVITRCKQLGWDPADDNEADALALLDYQRAILSAKYGAASGPLFTG